MNVFTSLSILILSMLIVASMQLIPGIFASFYHYASGKYSKKIVSNLSTFFLFGVETLPALMFIIFNYVLSIFIYTDLDVTEGIFLWIAAGLLVALGLAFFCFYFRRGDGTKLFISRKIADNYEQKAKLVKNNSDAYVLGLISGIPELLFTLPLYLIVLVSTTDSFILTMPCSAILVIFILLSISPLFFLYAFFRNGNNLAGFLKFRTKNKTFFRFFVPILYFVLALSIIIFKVVL